MWRVQHCLFIMRQGEMPCIYNFPFFVLTVYQHAWQNVSEGTRSAAPVTRQTVTNDRSGFRRFHSSVTVDSSSPRSSAVLFGGWVLKFRNQSLNRRDSVSDEKWRDFEAWWPKVQGREKLGVRWSAVKWSEVKFFGAMYYHWFTVTYVVGSKSFRSDPTV